VKGFNLFRLIRKEKIGFLSKKKYKTRIPKALREQVWILHMGRTFEGKCKTIWCKNIITVFNFESGHNIPESKGGSTTIENLIPICGNCNKSMGNTHTFDEWCSSYTTNHTPTPPTSSGILRYFSCF
jgi:hypothetical protein